MIVNGKRRDLRMVGVAQSPEFVYAIRPGALADDPKRYAILWMDRTVLAAAFELGGAFNDVTARLHQGDTADCGTVVIDEVDDAMVGERRHDERG